MTTRRERSLAALIRIARRYHLDSRQQTFVSHVADSRVGNMLAAAISRLLLPNPIPVGDLRVYWDGCHHAVLVFIRSGGMVEPRTIDVIRSLMQKDVVFVDVGASIGWHSLIAAQQGARVYAFEPHPVLYRTLCRNVHENNLAGSIEPIQKAVGDRDATVSFHLHPLNAGSSGLFSTGTAVQVAGVTLDSAILRADVVKVDAEGCEVRILAGMQNLVKRSRPTLICECSPASLRQAGHSPLDLYDALVDTGFQSISVIDDGTECHDRREFLAVADRFNRAYCNLICKI